ncbi:MAG: PEP-CTERM sorting domain-containing protein [Burkholderiales bacterium]|nr:MAG: PEP-CTERM sorting domain-containing protein [Burkholderiales bacterium]
MSLRIAALLGLSCLALSAHAQSQYRLYAEAYGGYFNNIRTTSPVFGLDPSGNPNTVLGTVQYGSDYQGASAFNQVTPIPDVTAGGVWAGDASKGMTTVTTTAKAKTDWGSNHASASTTGYTPVSDSFNGQFVVGGTTWPMQVKTDTSSYAVGHSLWEELYQIGGGTGTGQFTGSIHIDGSLSGLTNGTASMDWSLRTFSNQLVAALNASYDATTNSWTQGVFSNGAWTYTSGNGALSINQDVTGSYNFTYGAALYLQSDLVTTVNGNGAADFSNTVQFTGMVLPQDATVFVLSGAQAADYGIRFAGNGAGTICTTLACAVGNATQPIPEPETYALLLAGLGVVTWTARRRR